MLLCNLASSSSGNSTYIETKNYKILIDLGRNKKYIVDALKSIGVDYKDIDYVFLTHTHDDHTSAIRTFLKNHKAKLVLTNEMFMQLNNLESINCLVYEDNPEIDNLDIKTFRMSHDAGDTRAFLITEDEKSVVYITDTGYINSKYLKELKGKTMYCIESNHDVELLTHGPYPKWLQARVLSDVGHLSNKFTGIYLSKMIDDSTKEIMLMHLSDHNNDPNVALETVCEYVDTSNLNLFCAKKDIISEVINL